MWAECDAYTDVYGTAVLEIEYTDNRDAERVWRTACEERGARISVILRDRNLVPANRNGYRYQEC